MRPFGNAQANEDLRPPSMEESILIAEPDHKVGWKEGYSHKEAWQLVSESAVFRLYKKRTWTCKDANVLDRKSDLEIQISTTLAC